MNWLDIYTLSGYGLLPLIALSPFAVLRFRNWRHARGYLERMMQEHCLAGLGASEQVLATSRPQNWRILLSLLGAVALTFFMDALPNVSRKVGQEHVIALIFAGFLFASIWGDLRTLMTAIVVTTKGIYWCDFRTLTPKVTLTELRDDAVVWLWKNTGSASESLQMNGETVGFPYTISNRDEVFSAILDAIAALPPSPPPARPPS